jgi:3-deoxy-D-manno-octulosonic-acid transferase
VANGAALQVSNAEQALDTAYKLLDDNAVRNAMSEAGVAFCAAHSGATRRHMAAIERALPFAG